MSNIHSEVHGAPSELSESAEGIAALGVLIVDDEPEIRLMLRLILEQHECSFHFACDADQALDSVRLAPPELVLLDIGLREPREGLSLCAELKRRAKGRLPVVIMLTGDNDPSTIRQAQACGADGYLVKPFTPMQILGLIDSFDAWRIDPRRAPPAFWPAAYRLR